MLIYMIIIIELIINKIAYCLGGNMNDLLKIHLSKLEKIIDEKVLKKNSELKKKYNISVTPTYDFQNKAAGLGFAINF